MENLNLNNICMQDYSKAFSICLIVQFLNENSFCAVSDEEINDFIKFLDINAEYSFEEIRDYILSCYDIFSNYCAIPIDDVRNRIYELEKMFRDGDVIVLPKFKPMPLKQKVNVR